MKQGNFNFLTVKNKKKIAYVSFKRISKLSVLNCEILKHSLIDIVTMPGTVLEIDLSGIKFIDSSGFDLLNIVSRMARKYSSQVVLKNAGSEVMELIELVKKHAVLDIKNIQPVHAA